MSLAVIRKFLSLEPHEGAWGANSQSERAAVQRVVAQRRLSLNESVRQVRRAAYRACGGSRSILSADSSVEVHPVGWVRFLSSRGAALPAVAALITYVTLAKTNRNENAPGAWAVRSSSSIKSVLPRYCWTTTSVPDRSGLSAISIAISRSEVRQIGRDPRELQHARVRVPAGLGGVTQVYVRASAQA
jgi:hypothetical protein